MKIDDVRRDEWIVGGLALLLVLDLLILAWFSFGGGSGTVTLGSRSFSLAYGGGSLTATDAPDGWLGLLALLASLLVLVDIALERLSPQTQVPAVGGSRVMTRYVLAAAAAVFMGLKFLFHLGNFSNLGFGFWLGAVLVSGLLYFTMQARKPQGIAPSQPATPASPGGPPPSTSSAEPPSV